MNKSSGSDKIGNIILKNCWSTVSLPLSILFNRSILDSEFPSAWKMVDVCPIFKKNDPQDCSNYRPISLLSPTSKILERIVYNKLYQFCSDHGILTSRNSGFKKLDSTVNQLIHVSHLIYKGLDSSKKIAAIFLDLSKAFDSVWHDGLLLKLEKLGIRGKLLKWLRSYLTGRRQRVFLNGKCSYFLSITSGVPQGSILGPLLFLIYINDMVTNIESEIFLFADDTSLFSIASNWNLVQETLNRDLIKLSDWSNKWLISFNASKTVYMEISNKPCGSQIVLKLNDTILTRVTSHKHLGLVLNSAFTWSDHVTYICNKVSKKLGMLYKSKTRLNRNSLVRLYCTWIRPMIDYCSQCYDNLSTSDCLRLERLQRRAALTCTGAISRSATDKLFYDVGWPKLSDRRKSLRLHLIYKIINNTSTHYLINDFVQTQRRISFLQFSFN